MPPKRKGKRKFFLRLLLIVVVVAIIAWALWYFLEGRWYVDTDDAYVGGNVVQITPKVPGTVVSIGADNGDLVHAGQVLVKLDPSDADVALEAAEAGLAQAVRKVRGLYNNVAGAKAEVDARQVALDKARSDYNRRKGLAESGAISAEMLAHAHDALAAARSALISAKQQYHNAEALVGGTKVASNPGVKAAEAKLRAAYLDDVRTTLVAPVDGYVAKRTVQVGEMVRPGMALMAVVPLDQVWVDANFKETQLEHMRIGQPVELTSDLYGGSVTYHGQVESLGIGTGSAFSLLPAQNATGNWIKIVQRVPVRISLEQKELDKHPLRIGLSMSVTVNLHNQDGAMLAQTAPTRPVFTTDVYKKQLADANSLIRKIVQANLGHDSK
ncbi:MAG TPA: HlyD family efflux transporter periplasmic adaptor subunit [Rhodanobacteraceae bacterium]|nr:HlyD family efflux transporter periplasmic adaptor subunit [Rhodanobacteraceae bacterium]